MRLGPTASFYLLASIILFFLAGSSAPTPLYAVYQAEWGFSPITVTLVFGIYALAVLAMLLVVGSLSDYVGRRPVLLVATLVQAVDDDRVRDRARRAGADRRADRPGPRDRRGGRRGRRGHARSRSREGHDRERGRTDARHRDRRAALGPARRASAGADGAGLRGARRDLHRPARRRARDARDRDAPARRARVAAAALRVPPRVKPTLWLAAPALVAAWALAGFYGSLGPSSSGACSRRSR